jgi:hypothetical protein
MNPHAYIRILRKTGEECRKIVGTDLIPVQEVEPEEMDGGTYGPLLIYLIDGSRLDADMVIKLAQWIVRDSPQNVAQVIEDIQVGKACIKANSDIEPLLLDNTAWG